MKSTKKTCVHDSTLVALNAEKEKYLNYETSTKAGTTEYVCVRCHDSKELNFFGAQRKLKCCRGGYARVTSSKKLVLKENANILLLVEDEGQFLAVGNMLPLIDLIAILLLLPFN